uniref:Uncharacterized protein n=1 Tax=Leersia perrieri TaxID=77586 RepID=A0A0D9V285_9ORYZ
MGIENLTSDRDERLRLEQGEEQRLAQAVASPPPSTSTFPSTPVAMTATGKPDPAAPPEAPAKRGFMRRIFPYFFFANVVFGVYVVARDYKKYQEKKNTQAAAAAAGVVAAAAFSSEATTIKAAEPTPPKRVLPPLSEDEQRQVYKWMLEEKRKIKPRNAAEKNKINEEKALLKEFIRAESLPRL